jgi:hypothetical protein
MKRLCLTPMVTAHRGQVFPQLSSCPRLEFCEEFRALPLLRPYGWQPRAEAGGLELGGTMTGTLDSRRHVRATSESSRARKDRAGVRQRIKFSACQPASESHAPLQTHAGMTSLGVSRSCFAARGYEVAKDKTPPARGSGEGKWN